MIKSSTNDSETTHTLRENKKATLVSISYNSGPLLELCCRQEGKLVYLTYSVPMTDEDSRKYNTSLSITGNGAPINKDGQIAYESYSINLYDVINHKTVSILHQGNYLQEFIDCYSNNRYELPQDIHVIRLNN